MLKLNKQCAVCKALKRNTVLTNAIYNSAHFMKTSGVSLAQIADKYGEKDGVRVFTYQNLLNHVKKHQFLDNNDFNERHLRQIANEAEKTILKQTIQSKEVWDTVIDQGMERLQSGELLMTTGHLLKAAKDKSDYEMKQKDQQLAMMDMVFHFASGENERGNSLPYDRQFINGEEVENYDPTANLTTDSQTGEDGPSSIHYPPTRDATPPGPDPVSAGNY